MPVAPDPCGLSWSITIRWQNGETRRVSAYSQMAQAGMEQTDTVSGRDCSTRQMIPPGPMGRPNRSRAPKCRISCLLGDDVFLNPGDRRSRPE